MTQNPNNMPLCEVILSFSQATKKKDKRDKKMTQASNKDKAASNRNAMENLKAIKRVLDLGIQPSIDSVVMNLEGLTRRGKARWAYGIAKKAAAIYKEVSHDSKGSVKIDKILAAMLGYIERPRQRNIDRVRREISVFSCDTTISLATLVSGVVFNSASVIYCDDGNVMQNLLSAALQSESATKDMAEIEARRKFAGDMIDKGIELLKEVK